MLNADEKFSKSEYDSRLKACPICNRKGMIKKKACMWDEEVSYRCFQRFQVFRYLCHCSCEDPCFSGGSDPDYIPCFGLSTGWHQTEEEAIWWWNIRNGELPCPRSSLILKKDEKIRI